jgi:hypothetical protein
MPETNLRLPSAPGLIVAIGEPQEEPPLGFDD